MTTFLWAYTAFGALAVVINLAALASATKVETKPWHLAVSVIAKLIWMAWAGLLLVRA